MRAVAPHVGADAPRAGTIPDAPSLPSIPSTPGEILRAARLRRRLSFAEVEQATRIRARYLQALEDDDLGVIPDGVYSRGFLRNYAIYLGVPPEVVLSTPLARRRGDRRPGVRSVATPIKVNTPRSLWVILAGGVVALAVLALFWLGLTSPEEQGRAASATSPAAGATATALASLPAAAPAATTAAPVVQPTAAPAATAVPSNKVDVELRTTDRAWVRATVDGKVALEDTLPAGQVQRWSGQQSVLVRVGNAGAVDVTANGQHIGVLGGAGQVIEREFTR